jgi:hypothetical protein
MIDVFQALTAILIVCALAPALAYVLEFPGKLRLTKEAYFAVQPIYYPGFTIAGMSEPLGVIATLLLLVFTPRGNADFWLTLVAFLGLLGMQAVEPFAQCIAVCRRAKWSKHVTHSPFLARRAMVGSNAARKRRSACSHALG